MNKAFEKILDKLEELRETYDEMAFVEMNTNGHTLDFEYAKGKKDVMLDVKQIVQEVAEEYNGGWTNCSVFVEILKDKMMNDRQLGRKSLEAILSDIEQAELEYAGGWIPCSERLPEEHTVLCCDKYGEMIVGHPYFDEVSNTNYSAESDNEMMYNCIAWQPLPEPYKESD